MALIDLTGRKFDRLHVDSLDANSGNVKFWYCTCDCGAQRRVSGGDLKRGNTKSCGCLSNDTRSSRATTHGMSSHPAYRNWIHARGRCYDSENNFYKDYGGRGIKMCERWDSFEIFWQDMGPTWKSGLTIERENVNGNYEKSNCRWATMKEQANNRRNNVVIDTPHGKMTVTQAAELFRLKPITLYQRVAANWPQDRIFSPPNFNSRWHNQKEQP